jgi:ATP-dependent RNA helicase RhlE
MSFSDFSLSHELQASVRRMGFQQPTHIQRDSIPPAIEGRDMLASAETGSGKTAAFLLPIMNRLLPMQRGATRALVLAPTRELAAQIAEHFTQLAHGTRLTCAAVFGGVSMGAQERAFRTGVDMIVACPGRLLDHMQNDYVDFSSLKVLVLDEADRMLDMGFLPDIKRVLAALPRERQTMLFSATMPKEIVELSRTLLRDPARINVDRAPAPAHGVSHAVYPVPSDRKADLLLELLKRGMDGSVLVFTRTKHRANRLAQMLEKKGVQCARIHGNRSQSQRTLALSGFKKGSFQVLVATDIAARGIDVEALGYVVNFDVPHVADDYIHRVGRTARAKLTGEALTLVSPEEENDFLEIERALGKRLPRQKLDGFDYASKPREQGAGVEDRGGRQPARSERQPRQPRQPRQRSEARPDSQPRQRNEARSDNQPRQRNEARPDRSPTDGARRERSGAGANGNRSSRGQSDPRSKRPTTDHKPARHDPDAQPPRTAAESLPPGYVPLSQHGRQAGGNQRNNRRPSRW